MHTAERSTHDPSKMVELPEILLPAACDDLLLSVIQLLLAPEDLCTTAIQKVPTLFLLLLAHGISIHAKIKLVASRFQTPGRDDTSTSRQSSFKLAIAIDTERTQQGIWCSPERSTIRNPPPTTRFHRSSLLT